MTTKERDELLAEADSWRFMRSIEVSALLRRIILALPVEAEPPQPKPSMSAAVRELVRAAEDALPFVCNADKYRTIGTAIAAVKELFVEDSE